LKIFAFNNIILLAICAVSLSLGFVLTAGKGSSLTMLNQKVQNLEERREVLSLTLLELSKTVNEQASDESVAASATVIFPAEESPDISYAHFDELSRYLSLELNYHFRTEKDIRQGSVTENRYKLEGTGSFADIYQFVCGIERGPLYYRIHRLHLEERENFIRQKYLTGVWKENINFILELSGYSYQDGFQENLPLSADFRNIKPAYALFSPPRILIAELGRYDVTEEGIETSSRGSLPRISPDASLVAISGDIAYVRDSAGELVALQQGDQVFHGEVTRVDLESGMMEITPIDNGDKFVFRVSEVGMWGTRQ
jgi:hypothetical protein